MNSPNGTSAPPATDVQGDVTITNNTQQQHDVNYLRNLYYEQYSYWTGIRIAATLGGFFLLVLLTLLYKAHCRKHTPPNSPPPGPSSPHHNNPHHHHNSNPPTLLLTLHPPPLSSNNSPCSTSTSSSSSSKSHPLIQVILPTPTISPSPSRPLLFDLPNLKWVDDTSSEAVAAEDEDDDDDYDDDEDYAYDDEAPSLGSDSVFSPHAALVHAHQQQHHQIVHRDSTATSEVESVTDYLERRRSSSTQTTVSDLRACLPLLSSTFLHPSSASAASPTHLHHHHPLWTNPPATINNKKGQTN